jgi:hypothetical protein
MIYKLSITVVFLIFNRPDVTQRVFNEIALVMLVKLFVVADGPRPDRPDETERCETVRAIIEKVDLNCEVFKNYSDINLGCKKVRYRLQVLNLLLRMNLRKSSPPLNKEIKKHYKDRYREDINYVGVSSQK